ncbi:hypothetical protein AAF712_004197 [Marasmius tenuissimus]|uniref:Uncharacterized protein n=1 Tax=Marasmius tenuissimus TaxID=585030 RepID=A0ABR3A690_9AGAR|nr:hypothetical protein PM082_001752 [Marasmius tenuissimus]
MTRILATTAVAAGLAVASAQTLSSNCQNSLTTIVQNNDASACLAPSALVGIAAANSSQSLVDPINTWVNSVCGSPSCSNSTLEFIVNTVTDGCSTELSVLGYDSSQKAQITEIVKQVYPTARKVVCLQSGNEKCITKELKAVESSIGTLSVDNIVKLVSTLSFNNQTIPKDVYCSDCTKAAYNAINEDFPGTFDDSKSDIQQQCGASFVDGQNPSGVSQSAASTSGGNGGNGAMFGALPSLATSGLVVLGGLFALVA